MSRCFRCLPGLVLAVSFLAGGAEARAAFLFGQTLSFMIVDDITSPPSTYGPVNFVVNNTVELGVNTTPAVSVNIEVDDNAITFTYPSAAGFNGANFNGYIFKAISPNLAAFGSITIDPATTMVGFKASNLSFDATHFNINVAGLSVSPGTVLKLDVAPLASVGVPEPSSLILCGIAGLAGLGLARFGRGRPDRR